MTPGGPEHSDDEPLYPDLCHTHTHPDRMAAIGRLLMDVEPAPIQGCRVLEIGCAGGGNLVPMAYGLPHATFVGIERSARQIERAEEFAAGLGLRNIELLLMDLLDVTADLGTFDYIVAHGMYSWVPPDVRDKILAICRDHLAPTGLAYVSYNTLPGWSSMRAMREMMLFHTRHIADPRARARGARSLILQLRSMIPDGESSSRSAFLDEYVDERIGRFAGDDVWEDAAMLHDELGAVNEPVYFHQFIEHAGRHGLRYVADATFPDAMADGLARGSVARLQEMAADRIEYEQYLDFARQTTFRRTLLCHATVDVDEVAAQRMSTDRLAARPTEPQEELLPSARPIASPIVRLQAERSCIVSSLRHESIHLDVISHALVPLLDGHHTRDDLLAELLHMVDDGRLRRSHQHGVSRHQVEQRLADDLDDTLRWMAQAALLSE